MEALLSWQFVRVTGFSMTPTLVPGDRVLVRHGRTARPGSVVLARFRGRPDLTVIKRALATEGDGWLLGSDNPRAGSDSRQLGIADVDAVAVWIWHRGSRGSSSPLRRWLGGPVPAAPPAGL